MSPSWNTFRHPFASSTASSSSSSTQPTSQTAGPSGSDAHRERRESFGYEQGDFLPLPAGLSEDRRDSGRFSDAVEDDFADQDRHDSAGRGVSRERKASRDLDAIQEDQALQGRQDGLRATTAGESISGAPRHGYQQDRPPVQPDFSDFEPFNNYPASAAQSPRRMPQQNQNQSQYPQQQSPPSSTLTSPQRRMPSDRSSSMNPRAEAGLSPSQSFPLGFEQYSSSSSSAHTLPGGYPADSPRDRMTSSASYNSMSASLRGRRAPAPAALDLSPRSERVRREAAGLQGQERYPELGLGAPPYIEGLDRRAVTEGALPDAPRSRPLPQPPRAPPKDTMPPIHARSASIGYSPSISTNSNLQSIAPSAYPSRADHNAYTAPTSPHIPTSPSMPLSVPLSAFGQMDRREMERRGSAATLSTVGAGGRPSTDTTRIDSYYLTSQPLKTDAPEPFTPPMTYTPFEANTPGLPDPSTLDRRGLVGTGELATPRWNTSTLHQHMRTPSMPQFMGSSEQDQAASSSAPTSSGPLRKWSQSASGYGLGVGVMEGVQEESPQKGALSINTSGNGSSTVRNRALSHQGPAPPPRIPEKSAERYPTGSATVGRKGLDSSALLDLGEFGDFQFDSSMEAAIAASLAIPDEPGSSSTATQRQSEAGRFEDSAGGYDAGLGSAPPIPDKQWSNYSAQSGYAQQQYPSQQPLAQIAQQSSIGMPISPGTARARIYARRQERERRTSMLVGQPLPLADSVDNARPPLQPSAVPQRSSSKYTPPNSAYPLDVQSLASAQRPTRDARKTPPATRESAIPKSKYSPGSSHDIIKHFAPKDFSHLPPSPSSASINQFLKNSSSYNNISSVSSPSIKTPPAAGPSGGYFPTSPGQPPLPSNLPTPQKGTGAGGLSRSDSQKSQKARYLTSGRTQREGWDTNIDAETAEAMRKLDGLGGTPGRGKTGSKSKLSAGPPARSATPPPPTARKEVQGRGIAQQASQRVLGGGISDSGSPLTDWAHLAPEETTGNVSAFEGSSTSVKPVVGKPPSQLERPHVPIGERESSASASPIFTPSSRDSHTTATTPPSTAGLRGDIKTRRASASSEASGAGSSEGGVAQNGSYEKVGEISVPPVPPLPKGYVSMRQGLAQAATISTPGSQAQSNSTSAPTSTPSYIPLNDPVDYSSSPAQSPPSAGSGDVTRPKPNKKWSFSSAMSLKLNKDSSSPPIRTEPADSPEIGWMEVHHTDLSSPPPPPPPLRRFDSDSSRFTTGRDDGRSNASLTPVGYGGPNGSLAPPSGIPRPGQASSGSGSSGGGGGKRLTPSSIPFFRRTSSSSLQPSKMSPPITTQPIIDPAPQKSSMPPPSKIPAAPTSARKSMLGMHLPSMLRGSGSKRHLSQQLEAALEDSEMEVVEVRAELPEKAATTGWKGRSRGKTMSISGPLQPRKASLAPDSNEYQPQQERPSYLKPKASVDGSLNGKQSYNDGSNNGSQMMRPSRSGLPPVSATPSIRAVPSNGSLRSSETRMPPSQTPTKIPRLISRESDSPAGTSSMGPPSASYTMSSSRIPQAGPVAHSKTMSSNATMERTGISEFGAVGGSAAMRHAANDPQRSRLLAPMSMRNEPKPRAFAKAIDTTVRTERPANVPPSRRNMPLALAAPRSTATAMTISAQNKRTSRDVIPGMSRTSSKDSGRESSSDNNSNLNTLKPSKSLHANLVSSAAIGSGGAGSGPSSRIPSSSSVGAPGTGYRKASIVSEATTVDSPAEDEETLADAEMMAYVQRRKARVAAGSKKDDLADIEEFPDDIEPAMPISQRAYISKNLSRMTDFERKEILDFDRVYYTPPKPIIREAQHGMYYNHGYDDERGDYLVVDGDHMAYRYEVVKILGKGSFGQVAQCRDHKTGTSVAVKIIRNKKRFHAQALVEVKILGQLVDWDPDDKHYMVRMTDHFYFRSHLCIVTELLSINLYELIKANQFSGFSTTVIRRFTMQMLGSMQLMRSHRIVHCDLKPENILLMHPCKSGIKVIDFGSSCHESEKVYTYIQSRFYRSPEVILGMNYAMAIDMWSLGCILAELYTGVPIFPGENEHEQLACIMEVLGVPDRDIVNRAQRKKLFFGKRRRPATRTLAQVLKCKDDLFIDFISKCLTWDPDRRLKPQPAMRHPWILQGRRRYAPAPPIGVPERRGSEQSSGIIATAAPTRTTLATATAKSNDKKQLVISPPTPLVARVPIGQVPASAPRMGGTMGGSRVPQSMSSRGSSFMNSAKVGY